ncbi:TonB family protein [Caulobacter sp. LARHSG274]
MLRITAAFILAVLAGTAAAETTDFHPIFTEWPKAKDIAAAFPKTAFEKKITGEVSLECVADLQGRLTGCKIAEETPGGYGFGEAALLLTAKDRVKTKDGAGSSIVGRPFKRDFTFLAPGDSNPDWAKKPTAEALAAAFPTAAAKKGVDGRAVLACQVTIEGYLQGCKVEAEDPEGLGFGAAALQLSPQFRMTPKIRGGKPQPGGQVTIPVDWRGFRGEAVETVGSSSLVLDPPWVSAPTAAQVRAAWPAGAKDAKSGQAALRCELASDGGLKACQTISEIPAGRGFGKAARSLVPYFKVRFTPDQAKQLKNYSVDVPFRFRDPADPDGRKLTSPRWTRTLTAEGMAEIYPKSALAAGKLTGLGVIGCTVDGRGELTDCQVKREEPAAFDFGAAAMEAAKAMAMNPWTKEGDPVDGQQINLPIRFNWQGEPPEAASAGAPATP